MARNRNYGEASLSSLKTIDELSGRYLKFITPEQLMSLAIDGKAPCYILINPATEQTTYLFNSTELTDWLESKYIVNQRGIDDFNTPVNFYSFTDGIANPEEHTIPLELSAVLNLRHIPLDRFFSPSGIYFLCMNKEIVYVGQAANVANRISTHIGERLKSFDTAFFIPISKSRLNEVEMACIRHFRPRYNKTCLTPVTGRDAKIIEELRVSLAKHSQHQSKNIILGVEILGG